MLHGYFDIPTFHYFEEKNTWSGSNYTNFSYRIDPILGDEKELYVRVWYGTKCVTEVTDFVAEYHEEYSEKGLENVLADLTKEFEKFKLIREELEQQKCEHGFSALAETNCVRFYFLLSIPLVFLSIINVSRRVRLHRLCHSVNRRRRILIVHRLLR